MPRIHRLAFVALPSDNPKASRDFYESLFRVDFARSLWEEEGYHTSIAGVDFDVEVRHSPQETTTPFLQVEDLDDVLDDAVAAGGRVVWGPAGMRLPERHLASFKNAVKESGQSARLDELGRGAIIVDPGGGQIGLIQLAKHASAPISEHQKAVLSKIPELGTRNV